MSIIESITNGITKPLSTGIIAASGGAAGGAIASLDNVISDVDFSIEDNYGFGGDEFAETVTAVRGISLESSYKPTFDADAFGTGIGGMAFTGASKSMNYDSNFSATETQTLFLVVALPNYSTFGDVLSYAVGTGNGETKARFTYLNAFQWRMDEASQPYELSAVNTATTHIVAIRFNDEDDADVFLNSATVTHSFDPHSTYKTGTRIKIGSRSSDFGVSGQKTGYLLHTSDACTDEEIAAVVTELGAKFGKSIT